MGREAGAVTTYLPFENRLPVMEQTEIIYASTYLVMLLTPLLVVSGRALRRFALRGLLAMALIFPLYLLLPVLFRRAPLLQHLSRAICCCGRERLTRASKPFHRFMLSGR